MHRAVRYSWEIMFVSWRITISSKSRAATNNRLADLRLEEGLMQAGKHDKKAGASLQRFIRDFPKNPRVSEAWVSLAELAFHSSPPRLDEARKDLDRADRG